MNINEEFQKLLRPLSSEEYSSLEEDLLQVGCLDPIKTWRGTIVDGHNRFDICSKHSLSYNKQEMNFDSEDLAIDWMLSNQLGRRNLTKDDFTLLLGRRYNALKKAQNDGGKGRRRSVPQNEGHFLNTSEKLAKEHGVSRATVERAGVKAKIIDSASPELQESVRSRKTTVSDAAVVAELPEEQQASVVSTGEIKSAAQEIRKEKQSLITRNSGNNEWYTPPQFVDAARTVMGGISCDPASNDFAQKTINAETYYTIENSGLNKDWSGSVWMNPPYGKGLIDEFIDKLTSEIDCGNVSEAIVLVNNATDTAWFHSLANTSNCICLKKGRIKYISSDGEEKNTPIQGQVFCYYGTNSKEFNRVFSEFGVVAEVAG